MELVKQRPSIVIRDILHQRCKRIDIRWDLATRRPLAEQLAQDSTEELVAGEAEEAARISGHTDEVAQQ